MQVTQVTCSSQFFNPVQQIPKINPVSTQLLQTLNRDPRLRKVENSGKPSTLHDEVKQPVIKNKEDKKFDKPKKDTNKHRDSKRKEKSPVISPSKKEIARKTHKKTDRKERISRDEKYHKRKLNQKKTKELEIKKKCVSSNLNIEQNKTVLINSEISPKDEIHNKEDLKNDNMKPPISETKEIDVTEVVNEIKISNSINTTTEHTKTDSPLEDSDSLKRLRMYMQTMKKSPEPSTVLPLELKNDVCADKTNQSKINMSDELYFIIQFIIGDLLLFLNKLETFLHATIK